MELDNNIRVDYSAVEELFASRTTQPKDAERKAPAEVRVSSVKMYTMQKNKRFGRVLRSRTRAKRGSFRGDRVGTPFPLLRCLTTHYGRHCVLFPAKMH